MSKINNRRQGHCKSGAGGAKKILVVEDDNPLRNALKLKLEREGFSVIEAVNGEEGLKKAMSDQPDLILLDIVMPKMDGMTMLEELKKEKTCEGIPVIFLTNLSDSQNLNKAMKSGVYDYLIKSDWKLEDVMNVIKAKISD